MCYWKIIMTNGKEYIVQTEESNVIKFMERLVERGSFNDYLLAKPSKDGFITTNSVMIRADDVSSVEYTVGEK